VIETTNERGTEDIGQVLAVNATLALQNARKPETKLSAKPLISPLTLNLLVLMYLHLGLGLSMQLF